MAWSWPPLPPPQLGMRLRSIVGSKAGAPTTPSRRHEPVYELLSLLRFVMSSPRRSAPSPCTCTVIGAAAWPSMSRSASVTPSAESLIQTYPSRSARPPATLVSVMPPLAMARLPGYEPAYMQPVSPAARLSASFWALRKGSPAVPSLASLPDGEAYSAQVVPPALGDAVDPTSAAAQSASAATAIRECRVFRALVMKTIPFGRLPSALVLVPGHGGPFEASADGGSARQ